MRRVLARRSHATVITLGIACLIPHAIKALYYSSYPGFDDAFIHLRVAANLAGGKGWGVNAFEPVNLSSSPLFTFLLSVAHPLGLPDIAYGMALSAFATSAAIVVSYVAMRMVVSHPILALWPPIMFAVNVHLWRWNATVMEPTLACLILGAALCVFSWAKKGPSFRFALFGLVVGFAFLTRFELGLLLPAGALALVCSNDPSNRRGKLFARRSVAVLAGFVPIALVWFAYALWMFGTVVPTTFLAKASSVSFVNLEALRLAIIVFASSLAIPALISVGVLMRVARSAGGAAVRALLEPFLVAFLFAILCEAFYYFSMREFQGPARYLLPAVYALGIGVLGVAAAAVEHHGQAAVPRAAWVGVGMLQVLAMLTLNHLTVAPTLAAFRENYWDASRQAAAYLVETAQPDDQVFVISDIGMLAYYSEDRYRIVDGPGLASPTLVGLSPEEILRRVGARLVVEHYGEEAHRFPLATDVAYERMRSFPFEAPGLINVRREFFLNIYRAP